MSLLCRHPYLGSSFSPSKSQRPHNADETLLGPAHSCYFSDPSSATLLPLPDPATGLPVATQTWTGSLYVSEIPTASSSSSPSGLCSNATSSMRSSLQHLRNPATSHSLTPGPRGSICLHSTFHHLTQKNTLDLFIFFPTLEHHLFE